MTDSNTRPGSGDITTTVAGDVSVGTGTADIIIDELGDQRYDDHPDRRSFLGRHGDHDS